MMQKYKNMAVVSLTVILVLSLSICAWVKKPNTFSDSERRVLAAFPEISPETILNGDFAESFETYAQDQFPMRDRFRTIKALSVKNILMEKDNNDIYEVDGYVSKLEYPMKKPMLDYGAGKFSLIYDTYLKDGNSNVYLSIIPDKNYFLAEKNGYLSMDYDYFIDYMREKLPFAEYIDITDLLSIEDYYKTDTHWKQESILDVADRLAVAMGSGELTEEHWDKYTVNTLENPFYGVYKGQSALPVKPDTIMYLTSEILDDCKVTSYDTGMPAPSYIYDMEAAKGRDPYEMFMSGSDALLVLENENAKADKELIIFRDSFASSLTPLLAEHYSKIILVDIRYVPSTMLDAFIEFDNQDVLFIYSTMTLNNSGGFK